ncbi:MAG: enoyl-CoA hydratase/isomerase family protein [Desulfatitalea sp.]|nr:enoyl-CoA hydratase/isomerase family protein [Desulfatitalea sp.]MBI5896472.1 enoyl-CoA hydratase/isomerase family protein [Desulfobacterales bacterium]
MGMYEYVVDDHVAVLTMNNGENRFNFDSLKAFSAVLDEIEGQSKVNALVTTSAHDKIWSNGIDLDWLLPALQKEGESLMDRFHCAMFRLFRRVLTFPMPTVAAMNGHAFAAGAFLTFAHDFRFMRSDRGWLCMPEVDLGIPLGLVFLAFCKRVLPMHLLEEMEYTGRRLTAAECESYRIVRKACPLDQLMAESVGFAKSLNKRRDIILKMKLETNQPIIKIIDETIAACSESA